MGKPTCALRVRDVRTPERCQGGYVSVPLVSVALAIWARRDGLIRFEDLRTVLALLELKETRRGVGEEDPRKFRLQELTRLTGRKTGRGVREKAPPP